ncbi:MAG: hypothetical protein F4Y40_13155 [Acidimicrobiia bacterium]|nr:hypothetical protein [Acidimicrobiia bacterium]MYF83700.1 hypothetical protein [Acidimicrobiia bacterium]
MTSGLTPIAAELASALVTAYAPYVRGRVACLGLEVPPGLDDAIQEGRLWLETALRDLLGRPFASQDRGPLELFQEALRFPTAALEQAGHQPVPRDELVTNALPGDLFDLAPASSNDLGEAAWTAHLTWGASKAAAMTKPV